MKKYLSAILVLVLAFAMIPQVSADAKNAGTTLKEMGIIKGNSDGDLMQDKAISRKDSVVILVRLMGAEEQAASFDGEAFTDVPKQSYYHSYIAYAKSKGWVHGTGDGKFGMDDTITERQTIKLMLNALGYSSTDWNVAIDKARELGIYGSDTPSDAKEIDRSKVFEFMLNTLNAKPKGESESLMKKLGIKDPNSDKASADFDKPVLSSKSLKTLELSFSEKVDARYFGENSITIKGLNSKALLLDDEKTVRIIFASQRKQGDKIKLIINDIYNEDRSKRIENKSFDITIADNTAPKIIDANWLDEKSILLKVSEPMRLIDKTYRTFKEIELDGKPLMAKLIQDFEQNEVVVMFSDKKSKGSHSLKIKGLKDYSSKEADEFSKDIELAASFPAPEVREVKFVDNQSLIVYMSCPVYQKGLFQIDGNYDKDVSEYENRKDVLKVTFKNPFNTSVIAGTKLKYKGQKNASDNRVDQWQSFEIKAKDDTEFPTFIVKTLEEGYLDIEFSKSMRSDMGSIRLLNEDGKKILPEASNSYAASSSSQFVFRSGSNDRVLRLQFAALKGIDAKRFQLEVKGMRDKSVRSNPIIDAKIDFVSYDSKKPNLLLKSDNRGITLIKHESDKKQDVLRFAFSESMNEDDLKNLANYVIEQDGFGALSYVSGAEVQGIEEGSNAINIRVPNARDIKTSTLIRIMALRDTAGNVMETVNNAKLITHNKFYITSVVAVETDKLVITFNQDVRYFDESAIQVKKSNDDIIYISSFEVDGNKVTAYTNRDMPSNLASYNAVSTENAVGIKSVFMDSLNAASSMGIADEIRPFVVKIEPKDDHSFDVHLSEPVQDYGTNDVKNYVRVYDADGNAFASGSLTITYSGKVLNIKSITNAFHTGDDYKISILAAWDLVGNQSKVYETIVSAR